MTDPAGSDWPKASYAWWLVTILAAANMVSYMDRTILSLLVGPIETTLHITDTQMGLLQGTAFALFYSIIILPLGFVADRTNRTKLLAAGVALWSVMTATCGLATSFGALFLTRMSVGIGEAALAPTAPSIISDLLPVERRPPALGLYTVGSATGGGLALVLGGAITEIVVRHPTLHLPVFGILASWQVVCMAVGLPGLLVSLLLLVTGEPKRRGYTAQGASPQELMQFFKRTWPVILPHFGGFTLLYTYTFGAGAWWPTLFTRAHGWTIGQVGYLNDQVFPGTTGIGLSLASFCIALCLPAALLILYAAYQRRKHIATIPEYA